MAHQGTPLLDSMKDWFGQRGKRGSEQPRPPISKSRRKRNRQRINADNFPPGTTKNPDGTFTFEGYYDDKDSK